jgi:hypothetical protein
MAVGELVGFGLSMALGGLIFATFVRETTGIGPLLLLGAVTVVVAGVVEGSVVAVAQWLVLRRRIPGLALRKWLPATVAGAVLAYLVGSSVGGLASDS